MTVEVEEPTAVESDAARTAIACVEAGIEAAHPRRVVRESVSVEGGVLAVAGDRFDLTDFDDVVVLGGGNAAAQVAAELEAILGETLDGGVVVTDDPEPTERVTVVRGDHPVPSERGVEGAERVREIAEAADERTLVLAAITGGGSALLPAPADDLALSDLQETTDALLSSGATIHEINAVRKHVSAVKGGQLARAAAPATVASLVLSDVVGDDPAVVASGPTVPDETTYADALDVLDQRNVDVPTAVREHLAAGAAGDRAETPGPTDPVFDRTSVHVLGSGFTALAAARELAEDRGYESLLLSSRVRGEAREAAKTHAAIAEEVVATGNPVSPPTVVLSGGETTVTIRGDGDGGPNQEFALSAAVEFALARESFADGDVALAAVDTDGRDGATDAAGALVTPDTVDDPDAARRALEDNDADPFLRDRDALIVTGRTGTNVNDLHVLVIGE